MNSLFSSSRSFRGVGPALAAVLLLTGGAAQAQDAPPPAQPAAAPETRHTHDGGEPAPLAPSPAAETSLRAVLSHDFYGRSAPGKLFLKVDVLAPAPTREPATPADAAAAPASPPAPGPAQRPPLNLALVIDRSGSMGDRGKFDQAARAVALVVENLSERDTVSLIAFNQEAVVLSPAGKAVNKGYLRHRLSEVGPEGWTNLSAGMLEAFAQIDSAATPGQNNRVVVLTDGLANRGVTAAARLRAMAAEARARGIAVSTLGVGADFDPELLAALAEAGGGRYAYARAAEDIPAAMEAELSGFLSVTAQNARLEVTVEGGATITRVFGRPPGPRTDRFAADLGDLRDGEHGSFVLELAPAGFEDGDAVRAVATLTMDLPGSAQRVRQTAAVSSAYTADAARSLAGVREAVTVHAAALDALEKAEEAAAGLDTGRMKEVVAIFAGVRERARRVAQETRDQELLNDAFMLKHFMEELDAASRDGLMHGHDEARRQLARDADYQRYLMSHHRGER